MTLAFFHWKSASFFISRNADIYCSLMSNIYFFLIFLESLKIFLVKMVAILMISAKLVAPGLLKTRCFKISDVKTSVYEVTKKILSRKSNYMVNVVF